MKVEFSSTVTKRPCSAAIWFLMAAMALLLVVPQVDFPDAVSNRSTVLVSGLSHANGMTLASNAFAIVISQSVALVTTYGFHRPIASSRASAHSFLILLCSRRC